MIEETIEAAAARVRALWPGHEVYAGPIPQAAGGAFWVGAASAAMTDGLGRRARLSVELEVRYYLPEEEAEDFAPWAERMLAGMRTLETEQGDVLHALGRTAAPAGEGAYYALRAKVSADGPLQPDGADEPMERLEQAQHLS